MALHDSSSQPHSAILHYQAYLRCYIELNTTHSFRPLRWLYPGYHQPIQAVAILLVDLYRNPRNQHALESQTLIERLFSILQQEDSLIDMHLKQVHGRSHARRPFAMAWRKLEELRRTVWSKLGLNESTLLPDLLHYGLQYANGRCDDGNAWMQNIDVENNNYLLWYQHYCGIPSAFMQDVQLQGLARYANPH